MNWKIRKLLKGIFCHNCAAKIKWGKVESVGETMWMVLGRCKDCQLVHDVKISIGVEVKLKGVEKL